MLWVEQPVSLSRVEMVLPRQCLSTKVSHVVVVNDCIMQSAGYALPEAVMRTDFAGRDLTNWMVRLLSERDYAFTTTAERELVREMKEKYTYVASNFEEEMKPPMHVRKRQQAYKLPDGQEILLGSELFRCPEALFHPAMAGQQEPGIAELAYDTIMKSDVHIRSIYYGNILLTGGRFHCVHRRS